MSSSVSQKDRRRIWDMPTRVFHWLLVLAFFSAYFTHESDRFLYHHVFAGYSFLALLGFRLAWGVLGSHYARFTSFSFSWRQALAYVLALRQQRAARYLGHNPAGSWAIYAMLVLGLLVVASGLIVFGGQEGHGPLQGLISYKLGSASKELHEFFVNAMLLLVAVHVVGVVVESVFHKENLARAMITGFKPQAASAQAVPAYSVIAVLMLIVTMASAYYYFRGYLTETEDKPFLAFTHAPLPANESWQSECSDCHLAYHPSLLPQRSWKVVFEKQNDHFGDELDLGADVLAELSAFAMANSAEQGMIEASHKIMERLKDNEAPMRITKTRYWEKKHDEIDLEIWKSKKVKSKSNCPACHLDAKQGWFEDSNMRLPD